MSDRSAQATSFFKKIAAGSRGGLESLEAAPNVDHLELSREEASNVQSAWRKASTGGTLNPSEQFALEAIIIPDRRPAIDIIGGDYAAVTHPDWASLNDAPTHKILQAAFPSIGRIEVSGYPGLPYGGTGFVVGDGLLMTNRHVAELFASGLGTQGLDFITGRGSAIDFARDREPDVAHQLRVRRILMIHPYWDMSLLQVDGLTNTHPVLKLIARPTDEFNGRTVAVVGYPAFDYRNATDVQDRVFNRIYNVKRLLPGKGGARRVITSFENNVSAFTHDASTLGGNSGSAVVDPATGNIVGLHFAGVYLDANFAVPAWELSRDQRVVDAGVSFVTPAPDADTTKNWWRGVVSSTESQQAVAKDAQAMSTSKQQSDEVVTLVVPIEISVRIGAASSRAAAAPAATAREAIAPRVASYEEDPAAPVDGEISETADFETARQLANLGAGGQVETLAPPPPLAGEEAVTRTLAVDIALAEAFLAACEHSTPRVRYGLGAKAPFHGAAPGKDFAAIDCSGFVRELIWRSTNPHLNFPDGSVNQHDYVRAQGFQPQTVQDAGKRDGAVRIAFLRPQDSGERIGHVVIVHNGATLESHGGVGPDSRPWTGAGWQGKARVYLLSPGS